jgi:hypothetical protein
MKQIELINEYFDQCKLHTTPESRYIHHLMDILYQYGKKCEGGHIVEIGVETMISSWAWLKSNPSKITLCDISFDRAKPKLKDYQEICNANKIELILEEKSSHKMRISNVDLLFIDGLHTYAHVLKELNLFEGDVKQYIIMHDIIKFPGVNSAMNDFLSLNENWTIDLVIEEFPGLSVLKRVV